MRIQALSYVYMGEQRKADSIWSKVGSGLPYPHELYASSNDYKAAYESLSREFAYQDSILKSVASQEVTYQLATFEEERVKLKDETARMRSEINMLILSIALLAVCFLVFIIFRLKKSHKQDTENLFMKTEQLKKDLEVGEAMRTNLKQSMDTIFTSQFVELEKLCELCYLPNGPKNMRSTIDAWVNNFREDKNYQKNLEGRVDACFGDIMKDFRHEVKGVNEQETLLFLCSVAGLKVQSLSLVFGVGADAIYNRKTRLRKKIKDSGSPKAEWFLDRL